jgi:hypothetical protein
MRKLGSGPAFSHEPASDLCQAMQGPVLAIYGISKPAQALAIHIFKNPRKH